MAGTQVAQLCVVTRTVLMLKHVAGDAKVPTRRFDSGMELLPPGTTPQSSSQGLVGLSPILAV